VNNAHQILTEIVEKIQVTPNFTVAHPDYPTLELEPEICDRLQQLSPQLQSKYLIIQVQNYLYDLYFSHSAIEFQKLEIAAQQPSQIQKNDLIDGVDIDFCQRLQQSNSSRGYLDPDWQVVAATPAGELVVVKDGLHLHINPQYHLPPDFRQAQPSDFIPIFLPPNLVGKDAYIIVGNSGKPATDGNTPPSVRVYFNFTPDAAVAIADRLTRQFNQLALRFEFAILHDPGLFHRYDSGKLYLGQSDYLQAQTMLAEIYRAYQSEFSANIPVFAKQLAPGLGVAEEPPSGDTFGIQRCKLVATALVTAMERGETAATDKLRIVRSHFMAAGIDWLQPHLNPAGLDCYAAFEI
jgi:HopA1 effector protein family